MSKSSQSSYRAAFKKCDTLHDVPLTAIKKAQMQEIMYRTSSMSKQTQTAIKTLLRSVFKYGLENDIVQKDYSVFVDITAEQKDSTRRPFTDTEIKYLWQNINFVISPKSSGILGKPMIDTILIMIYTGIRVNELLDIKTEYINIQERYIDLHGTKTKAARRIVPIHRDILPLIAKRLDGIYLVPGNNNDRLSYSTYKYTFFNQITNILSINHNPHDCRHSFATYAARSNMDSLSVKRILGHTTKDITLDVYTHSFISDLVSEIDKFNVY